jgi:hypothetical protein
MNSAASSARLLMAWKEVMENFYYSIDFNLYLVVTRDPQEPLGYSSPLGYSLCSPLSISIRFSHFIQLLSLSSQSFD